MNRAIGLKEDSDNQAVGIVQRTDSPTDSFPVECVTRFRSATRATKKWMKIAASYSAYSARNLRCVSANKVPTCTEHHPRISSLPHQIEQRLWDSEHSIRRAVVFHQVSSKNDEQQENVPERSGADKRDTDAEGNDISAVGGELSKN